MACLTQPELTNSFDHNMQSGYKPSQFAMYSTLQRSASQQKLLKQDRKGLDSTIRSQENNGLYGMESENEFINFKPSEGGNHFPQSPINAGKELGNNGD